MKKRIYLNLFAFVMMNFICCSFILLHAQALDSTLAIYSNQYQHERTYIHYDKSAYAPGETIWFKAYMMKGILPAEDSKTLYVDWIDDKGIVLLHASSPIVEGGVTNGQFEIPANYKGTRLNVRAYTKWMLNFDSSFVYEQSVRILFKNPSVATAIPAVIASLQFFPEGGDLITGIKNKIAFKAADQWGRPVKIKGIIQKGNAFADSLKTIHDGMGFFYLIPEAGVKYTAKWKDVKGVEHNTDLPLQKEQGISIQLGLAPSKRLFILNRKENAPENLKLLHLVGTMQQTLVFKATANLANTTNTSSIIPTEALPTGVLTITVFDNNWNAVAERITFINNNEYHFPAEINVQRWGLSKRARNEVEIIVPPDTEASLSVSVTDAAIETDSSNNIFSHLLLTSELKGNIHKPAYYFSNNSDSIAAKLDLVMLTNGWRRFKWEDITKRKLPIISFPRDTTYMSLSGKLFGLTPNQLSTGGNIMMMVKATDSAAKMVMAPVMRDGTFNDPGYIFFDSLRIYYQPSKTLAGASVSFMTSRIGTPDYSNKKFSSSLFPDTSGTYRHLLFAEEQARMQELLKGKMLEAVTVTAKIKPTVQVLDEKYASAMFRGDGYKFDVLNDPFSRGAQNIFTYLQGRVAGLQINTSGSTPTLDWRGGAPLLYLDEMSTDPGMISNIPVADIAYIKVMRPPFSAGGSGMYGNGGNGAIAIYTRKGSDAQPTPGKGLSNNTVVGYTPLREFYAPNYASVNLRNEQRDIRTTLYWTPQVITSRNKNKTTLVFYNNDVTKAFRVIVEGVSKDGQLTHVEQLME